MPSFATQNDSPNIPKRLLRALKKAGSWRRFAESKNVNISYLSNLLRLGIEPTDRTEIGQAVRVKLFLPRTKRKQRQPRLPRTPIQKAISKMMRNTNDAVRMRE